MAANLIKTNQSRLIILWLVLVVSSVCQMQRRLGRKIQPSSKQQDSLVEIKSYTAFTTCIDQCKANRRCVFVNYQTRKKVCYKNFIVGRADAYVAAEETKQSSFAYWEKDSTKRITEEISTTTTIRTTPGTTPGSTPETTPELSNETLCEQNPSHEYCEVFCRRPQKFKSIPLKGNLVTIGSRQSYSCYDQLTNSWYQQIMICTEEGNWTNEENVCSYHYPIRELGKDMMYKIVKVSVPMQEAFLRCKLENAGLIKVISKQLYLTFQAYFKDKNVAGKYWTDSNGRDKSQWVTSDGEKLPKGVKGWTIGGGILSYFYNCATLNDHWKLGATDCDDHHDFICEKVV